jgi:hypothetical protein
VLLMSEKVIYVIRGKNDMQYARNTNKDLQMWHSGRLYFISLSVRMTSKSYPVCHRNINSQGNKLLDSLLSTILRCGVQGSHAHLITMHGKYMQVKVRNKSSLFLSKREMDVRSDCCLRTLSVAWMFAPSSTRRRTARCLLSFAASNKGVRDLNYIANMI